MKIWKALGLAGLAGVAATGVVIARDQRKRSDLTPEEIRDRLHERLRSPDVSEDVSGDVSEDVSGDVSDGPRPDAP